MRPGGADGDVFRWAPDVRHDIFHSELMSGLSFGGAADGAHATISHPNFPVDPHGEVQDLVLDRPSIADLLGDDQLGFVLAHAQLRDERQNEIYEQVDEILPFFASILNMQEDRHQYTLELFDAMLTAVRDCHMQMKHRLAVPRPADLDPRVQPMLPDPGHGSCPSGHATESRFVAEVLRALLGQAWVHQDVGDYLSGISTQCCRLAKRIAINRTIAGLHYAIDNAHGETLAFSLAAHFVKRCSDGETRSGILAQIWDRALAEWRIPNGYQRLPVGT